MKKVKVILITIAIVSALSIAWATRPCDICEFSQQYYRMGGGYVEAGVYGDNYICWDIAGSTCTYYKPNPVSQPNFYLPCRSGVYQGE